MGSDSGYGDEKPVHTVTLDEFYIDMYEVSNAQYATFLNEKGNQSEGGVTWLEADSSYVRIHQAGNLWQVDSGYENHPVVEVSWYGAKAYCEWRGGRLPTEAEWEKAARSTDARTYPWGNEQPTCDLLNYYDGSKYCVGDTTAVGNYPAGVSPYGAYDMAGNVWEWTSSKYWAYPYNKDDGREDLSGTDVRVIRGGSWYLNGNYTRSAIRYSTVPSFRFDVLGFRCAQ
jgi:formylglycine-generating enzyme required for sulfatase activity